MGFATDIWVEAECFNTKGGWVVDQQFMDKMGSPYLLAHGMGAPVQAASTPVVIPETATYNVYVRTYNWTSPWKQGKGPGAFHVRIGGYTFPAVLGVTGNSWEWQYAGKRKLKAGECTLELVDKTGFDGRCDAVYLTTSNQVPPNEASELEVFRNDKNPTVIFKPLNDQYDLVVIGGGVAGISAAIAAARLGCKVALVNDRPVLGGNNSSEIRVHLGGAIEAGPYPALGGLQKEFGPLKGGNAQPASYYEDIKKQQLIEKEPNIDLYPEFRVVAVDTVDGIIRRIGARNIQTNALLELEAPLFADCTGDGTVGYLAGAHYRMGREAYDEFGESTAPQQADSLTMGSSVQWYSEETSSTVSFPVFEYGVSFSDESCEKVAMGEWTWETGMNKNQVSEFEYIRDYGLLVVYSNWSYLKNRLPDNGAFRKRKLGWVAFLSGKRESRRLMGDYVLKEDDIRKRVFHEDGTAATTWSIDLHYPDPENTRYFPNAEFKSIARHIQIDPYPVPYRCLYSRNIPNLFMAGRNISVTHVALGTTRVMRTTGMLGEVVGMAAFLCKQYGVSPRAIYQSHLPELQKLMTKGVGGYGLLNNQLYNGGEVRPARKETLSKE